MFKHPIVAFDPASLGLALTRQSEVVRNVSHSWEPREYRDEIQLLFLDWYLRNMRAIEKLPNLRVVVSTKSSDLGSFLAEVGHDHVFHDMKHGQFGFASVRNIDAKLLDASPTTLACITGHERRLQDFEALTLRVSPDNLFSVPFTETPLVRLTTTEEGAIWLLIDDHRPSHTGLVEIVEHAMITRQPLCPGLRYDSVTIPVVSINTQASLEWMRGLRTGIHELAQAHQQIDISVNQAPNDTVLTPTPGTTNLTFDTPFIMWFTNHTDDAVPTGVCYADQRTWQAFA